eukprot:8632384-Pyramimonas_sp.AAC.1
MGRKRARSPTPTPEWLSEQAAPHGVPDCVKQLYEKEFNDKAITSYVEMVDAVFEVGERVEPRVARDLDAIEICCGWGQLSYWCRQKCKRVWEFDRRRHPDESLNVGLGMFWCVLLLLRVEVRGLMWLAPECSTWTFVAMGHTKRNIDINGAHATRDDVRDANDSCLFLARLWRLAHARSVWVMCEQPADSCLYQFPPFKSILEEVNAVSVFTWLSGFGHEMAKPTRLQVSNGIADLCQCLIKPKPPAGSCAQPYHMEGKFLVTEKVALRSSGHYPKAFCKAIADLLDPFLVAGDLEDPKLACRQNTSNLPRSHTCTHSPTDATCQHAHTDTYTRTPTHVRCTTQTPEQCP